VTDQAGLVAANSAFYESFEALDLDVMDALWEHDEAVFCVHPGSPVIIGWGPVRRSWAAIFASTDYLQFIVTDVVARVDGVAGWVTCTENILAGAGRQDELGSGLAVATNIFRHDGHRWRMTGHHASPVMRSGIE
jgi:hypothetical protein